MSHKRKRPVRLQEDHLDASEFVSIRRVRQTDKDGRSSVKRIEEAVYDPPATQEQNTSAGLTFQNADNDQATVENNESLPMNEQVMVRKPTKRQRDYIQQFVDRIDSILGAMMSRECLKQYEWKCTHCDDNHWAVWRCKDCLLAEPMCRHCMRSTHLSSTFHRIEQWTGTHYQPASLSAVGVYVLVRHRGDTGICDTLKFYKDSLERSELYNDRKEQGLLEALFTSASVQSTAKAPENFHDRMDEDEQFQDTFDQQYADAERKSDADFDDYLDALQDNPGAEIQEPNDDDELIDEEIDAEPIKPYLPEVDLPSAGHFSNSYVRVVHTNGIHQLALVSCECGGAQSVPLDLIALRLIPTSFQRIRTLFTAPLLDAFRLSSLELKASAYQFYRLLRRYTNPMAPASVLNLYNEFRRMSRLWRWTKKLKWAGFAGHNHRSALDVRRAELANYCPACPQIGINVKADWEADPNRFVYRRIFVADGNFKADHVRPKKPSADKAPCETTFRAITNSLLASKACDVTGVVAIACARHGCYAPNALCDLYRGEQQKNVDYALLAAILHTKVHQKQGVMMLYDIICQYIIHLYRRLKGKLSKDLEVCAGIGMFHVHDHQDECFFRFAPSLIPGAGCVCGEILESLWSTLNVISPTVRTATLAHRAEMLDDHTGDSNHKKLLGMAQFLVHQYFNARKHKEHYNDIFFCLQARSNPLHLQKWQAQIEKVEAERQHNRAAMDIYGADLSLSAQADLVDEPEEPSSFTSVDLWIQLALVVEEKQIEIRRKVRTYGKTMIPSEHEELETLRTALGIFWAQMTSRQQDAGAEEFLPREVVPPVPHLDWEDIEDDEDANAKVDPDNTASIPTPEQPSQETVGPPTIESKTLPLPSYNAADEKYREAEIKARIHQANRNLSALRELIVSKAFQYLFSSHC